MTLEELSPSQKNQSTEKAMEILEFLAGQTVPTRLADLSEALSMNNSTVLRFLNTLQAMGYVAQEPDSSRYFLTYKICSIASKVISNNSLARMATPHLHKLAYTIGESVCMAVEQDSQVVYIVVEEGPAQMVKTMQRIGSIAPMHSTGIGKLLLMDKEEDSIDALIAEKGMIPLTYNTITTKDELLSELETVRQLGYAYDNEECEIGAKCIAFPIYDYSNEIVAGISVTGPTTRITPSFIHKNLPHIKQAAEDISHQLGAEL